MSKSSHTNDPIKKTADVKNSSDSRIDEDFKGFPGAPSKENIINPKTKEDRKTAAVDEENNTQNDKPETDEMDSDGSGSAFESTEKVSDKSYYQKKDDLKKGENY